MNNSTINKLLALNKILYEKEAYDWSKSRKEIWEKDIIRFTKDIPEYSSVLDLGCGNARLYQLFAKKKISYLGIDQSKNLINIDKNNYPTANFRAGDILKLKYKNRFDYIISIAALHHIPSNRLQLTILKNCFSALKPKGILFLSVWNRWQKNLKKYFSLPKKYPGMKKEDLLIPWKQTQYQRYVHAFKIDELKKLAKISGFKKIDCYYADKNGKTNKVKGLNIILKARK